MNIFGFKLLFLDFWASFPITKKAQNKNIKQLEKMNRIWL